MSDVLFGGYSLKEDWTAFVDDEKLNDTHSFMAYYLFLDLDGDEPNGAERATDDLIEILNDSLGLRDSGFEYPALMALCIEAVVAAIADDANEEALNAIAWSIIEIYLRFAFLDSEIGVDTDV